MNDIKPRYNMNNEEFLLLVKEITSQFTKGRSSSLPTPVAQNIVKSILFTIEQNENINSDISLKKMVDFGRKILTRKVNHANRLYNSAIRSKIDIANVSYFDTYNEINIFFKLYDIKYAAHDIPCLIDYQLMDGNADMKKQGVDFIIMFLERLIWENKFCSFFRRGDMISIYRNYAKDYIEQIINLCEPIYANSIGALILGKDITDIILTEKDQEDLHHKFLSMDRENILCLTNKASQNLCEKMGFVNKALNYFSYAAFELGTRINKIKFTDGFNNIFISC